MANERISTLQGIARQLCPRCRAGKIFLRSFWRGFPKMNERCPVCGLKFEREQGYFLGAMYISYGLALPVLALLTTAVWSLTGWDLTRCVLCAVVLFLPLALPITYFARVLWI